MLRRMLRTQEQFVTLREELASINEYLDIEAVRFGPTLVVEQRISPDSLDLIIPSMVLQPLVENSIKHGIEKKVGGGRIIIRGRRAHGHGVIEVIDNGAGMADTDVGRSREGGIGLRNVDERLRVIYGRELPVAAREHAGRGNVRAHRDSYADRAAQRIGLR